MVELFEQNYRTLDRQSSKGNQLKWEKDNIWYKADAMGYEGLAEYVISHLLQFSNLNESEFVLYEPVKIRYRQQIFKGASSRNFLKSGWQIITLERLFQNCFGESLNKAIWTFHDCRDRLQFIVEQVSRLTGLKEFGRYMSIILTSDAFFLNEDRHTHNLAVLMDGKGEFAYCPVFDNGAGLLSDTSMDYPMGGNVYEQIGEVQGKTITADLNEQLEISETTYGCNLKFHFTSKDLDNILALSGTENDAEIYSIETRERVRMIVHEQMRKYRYLFSD